MHRDNANAHNLRDAIESIKYGIAPPVAFPTETVYGLGADATNESAVAGIFAAKGRPSDNPLIVHVSSTQHLEEVIDQPIPEFYVPVVEKFWPGPLTILLPVPKDSKFARNVHPGQNTIGFRMPSSKYARFFIAATGKPIAGPSANSSGKPSPTTAYHVLDDLRAKINFILDGGACDVGVESTVVDGLCDPPLILRPGGVSREELKGLGGKWANTGIGYDTQHHDHDDDTHRSSPTEEHNNQNGVIVEMNGAPRAPGMKYKHYSPTAQLILFTPTARRNGRIKEKLASLPASPGKTGKVRIAFLDRTWGSFGGLDLDLDLDLDVVATQTPSSPLMLDNGIHETDVHAQANAWQPYLRQTTMIQTPCSTLLSLPINSPLSHTPQAPQISQLSQTKPPTPSPPASRLTPSSPPEVTAPTVSPPAVPSQPPPAVSPSPLSAPPRKTLSPPPPSSSSPQPPAAVSAVPAASANPMTILARELFAILRFCDVLGCDYIFAETVERRNHGNADLEVNGNANANANLGDDEEAGESVGDNVLDAVADRLRRAATEIVED